MHLSDLNIEKEIVPLFDNYLNRHSHQALLDIFSSVPENLAAILERQDLLKGLINNLDQIQSVASYRTDVEQVFAFTSSIVSDYPFLNEKSRHIFSRSGFRGRQKDQLVSRCIQLTFLFNRLYQLCFKNLKLSLLPPAYQQRIKKMTEALTFFTELAQAEKFLPGNAAAGMYYKASREIYARAKVGEWQTFWPEFFIFDAYVSIAVTIRKRNFCFPVFTKGEMEITNGYHPLVPDPVKNSFSFSEPVILLTGPNMSGKSTFLKTISLCAYLAGTGLAVPADRCAMPFYGSVHVHLNIKDELQSGLSHFMAEVRRLKELILLVKGGEKVFAVFDEIYSRTDIDDAHELLGRTVRGLQQYPECCFVLSTHFNYKDKIESLHSPQIAAYYLDAAIREGKPVFTYQLKKGWSEQKFGLLLFEQEGLNKLLE